MEKVIFLTGDLYSIWEKYRNDVKIDSGNISTNLEILIAEGEYSPLEWRLSWFY